MHENAWPPAVRTAPPAVAPVEVEALVAEGPDIAALCWVSDAVPASIAPGDAVVLEYGFVVPVDQRGSVSVVVDSGAGSRAAVFQGEAPTS